MAHAVSVDLRYRIVVDAASSSSRQQAAARFGVSITSAIRWVTQAYATGNIAAKPRSITRKNTARAAEQDAITLPA